MRNKIHSLTPFSTNLPMEIMGYPDFPAKTNHSYVHHSVVMNYLVQYAKTFDLYRFIHVSHFVFPVG